MVQAILVLSLVAIASAQVCSKCSDNHVQDGVWVPDPSDAFQACTDCNDPKNHDHCKEAGCLGPPQLHAQCSPCNPYPHSRYGSNGRVWVNAGNGNQKPFGCNAPSSNCTQQCLRCTDEHGPPYSPGGDLWDCVQAGCAGQPTPGAPCLRDGEECDIKGATCCPGSVCAASGIPGEGSGYTCARTHEVDNVLV